MQYGMIVIVDRSVRILVEQTQINAFFNALKTIGVTGFDFLSYNQDSISQGSDSKAISYIQLRTPDGRKIFGVGISSGVFKASVRGILSAINRSGVELNFTV